MEPFTERQQQIMNASIELIAEQSIQGLTIKNIAKKIKLTEGAIYRHFPSKNDILLGILQSFKEASKKTLVESCESDRPALDQIKSIFTRNVQYFSEKPAVTAVIFSESIFQNEAHLSKEVFSLLEMHERALNCIIERGQKQNEIRNDIAERELTIIVIGSIRYTVKKWRLSGFSFDIKAEFALILDSLTKMLVPR